MEKRGPNLIPRYRANRINNGQLRLLLFDDNNRNANLSCKPVKIALVSSFVVIRSTRHYVNLRLIRLLTSKIRKFGG
ncbi:hypothetical protein PUN28_006206 [Cardiocondyla obscurior]|uniref:Uncharacterized protein n=1 Tax=Cardiocondyla obscurior TaxID=286306 RepID=A0AAW2GAG4_9HYME